ncbi:MAG: hypothetical protein MUP97_15995, partial [Acidimicrobiia bacterium]|nr:hypothetical protein [Acidimicrobiia bacterium]
FASEGRTVVSSFRGGLHPIYLRRSSIVSRALAVACPICRELPGQACRIEDGKPVVHDARESIAYNGRKIWV